jgi:5'-nucleotidase
VRKTDVLVAFNPHIFFDDQAAHVEDAAGRVPTGRVLYRTDSKLRALQEERQKGNGP